MSEFSERVYDLIRRIPAGRVMNYGGVAAVLGTPRAARGVGYALAALPEGTDVPWWRVVNRNGEISIRHDPFAARLQRALLEDEGVEFGDDDRIDLRRFRWHPEEADAEAVARAGRDADRRAAARAGRDAGGRGSGQPSSGK